MDFQVEPMTMERYEEAFALWTRTEGIATSETDSRDGTKRFLDRNAGLCFVAVEDGRVVGTVMCGFDGRRGYMTHLAVDDGHRRRGIAKALVKRVVEALRREKIPACNLFILDANVEGRAFWESQGWTKPNDWGVMWRRVAE